MCAETSADRSDKAPSGAAIGSAPPAAAARRQDGFAAGPLAWLLVALAAGAVAWVLLETFDPVFAVPEHLANLPTPAPVEDLIALEMASRKAETRNAILFVGILGAAVGGSLAVGEGVARRSGRAVLTAALAATAVAAAFGCLAALAGHAVFDYHRPLQDLSPLAKTIRTQGAMLATLGAGIGLAVGLFSGSWRTGLTCLAGGLLAGVLAGMVYPMLAAVFLPGVATELVVPLGAVDRLLWIAVIAGLAAAIISSVARRRPPRESRPATEQPPPPSA